jgi:hypothetical protein
MAWTPARLSTPLADGGAAVGPVAIEFRDDRVRMLQLKTGCAEAVHAAACVAWNPERPADCADALLAALVSGGFRVGRCVLGLPFALVRAETMTVPEGDDARILADLSRRARWRHGIGDPELGILRLGHCGAGRIDVALVVADREAIEAIVDPLIDRGVLPDAAEPSFVSVARASSLRRRRASDRGSVCVAIDLHAEGAVAMLVAGDRIVHCATAEEREDLPSAVAVCIHDGAPHAGGPPSDVRIVGAVAPEAALVAAIEEACGLPVRSDDEVGTWTRIRAKVGVRGEGAGEAAAWAGVFGLAHRRLNAEASGHRRAA